MKSFMLDSNVWEKAICPDDYPNEEHYKELNKKIIKSSEVEFYLSSTIFDLEDIRKKDRLIELKSYKPVAKTNYQSKGDVIPMKTCIGTSTFPYKENPILEKHAKRAFEVGFRVVPSSLKIGIPPINPLREQATIHLTNEQIKKIYAASKFVEQLGSGISSLNAILKKYEIKGKNLLSAIKLIPENAIKQFSEAISEWADGETVAAYIGMDINYLVTNDRAGTAGIKSIFYKDNIQKLTLEYPQFKVISPSEMLRLL